MPLNAYYAHTKKGRCAIWIGACPTVEPFRQADYFLETCPGASYSVAVTAMRALAGADALMVHALKDTWSAAASRVLAGRQAWTGRPPVLVHGPGFLQNGRSINERSAEMFTAEEIARTGELEAFRDKTAREFIAGWRKRSGPHSSLFTIKECRTIEGIERGIADIFGKAFHRRHPRFDWEAHVRESYASAIVADAFSALGILPTSSMSQVRTAWRRAALLHHPDRGGSAAEFQRVKAAYDSIVASLRS
jgi:hypothetical protein